MHKEVEDLSVFKDKRVMVLDKGDGTIKTALELTKLTPRVVFMTASKEVDANPELKKQINQNQVKIHYESEKLEIKGEGEVEKVMVHDLNEDEEYELFIDALIISQ